MPHLQLSGVSLSFGERKILNNVTLHLKEGSRAALSGINGSGKSTLLKVIAGETAPDDGNFSISKESVLAYLPQSTITEGKKTLIEELRGLYTHKETSGEDTGENNNNWAIEKKISMVLTGLGFSPEQFEKKLDEFSSGWKMRIALSKVLLKDADFLLLDEPTNYLDIEARVWLLKFLQNFKGGFLLVSHDRFFLDNAINEVYDLFLGVLRRYSGNYSSYENQRSMELEELIKRHGEQQEEIKRNEDIIRRFRYKASKAAMVQDRIKRLEKIEKIEIPENLKKVSIKFPEPPHSGKIALTLKSIKKSYGEKLVLNNIDLQIDAGDRLVVAGKNGAGKSTLLRIMGGEDNSYEGGIVFGTGISAGYFSVDITESIGTQYSELTALQFMEKDAPLQLLPKIRDMLGAFLFRGDDVYKALKVLSGGEKSRLALLKLLIKPLNLLILDEPTNHLDVWTKDILLDALNAFSGTIIFVCHDRDFMEKLSTKTLYLDSGTHKLYYGGYGYFLEKIEADLFNKTDYQEKPANKQNKTDLTKTYEEQKKSQAEIKKRKRLEDALFSKMEKLETDKAELTDELSKPENYSNAEKAKELDKKIKAVEYEIEALTGELEKLLSLN